MDIDAVANPHDMIDSTSRRSTRPVDLPGVQKWQVTTLEGTVYRTGAEKVREHIAPRLHHESRQSKPSARYKIHTITQTPLLYSTYRQGEGLGQGVHLPLPEQLHEGSKFAALTSTGRPPDLMEVYMMLRPRARVG